MEDIFITKIYSSGVLRYSETNSDITFMNYWKYTAKGPNALGNRDSRRIPIRQRILHPSMLGWVDVTDTSASDPGRSGSLSPYSSMKSLYFDDSLYENKMHYKISQYLDELESDDNYEEIKIVCNSEDEYNNVLDNLCKACENKYNFNIYGVSNNPMEIILEKDPRENYRKFDEESFLVDKPENK